MFDVGIVGGGLFGAIIAAALRRQRASVVVIDAQHPGAGSKPAACLMRPSWFSSLGKEVYNPSLVLLDACYGVEDIVFDTPGPKVKVHWCDPKKVLVPPDVVARVSKVRSRGSSWMLECGAGAPVECRKVVVAAGVWSELLAPVLGGLVGQAGMACLWPQEVIERPFVRGWAPYKQITAFNRGDGLWVGDSNAVRMDRWNDKIAAATEARCQTAVGNTNKPHRLYGVRPYSKAKPCYLKEQAPGLWVATGGAKNGTLAAGWCASDLVRRL